MKNVLITIAGILIVAAIFAVIYYTCFNCVNYTN